MSNKVLTFVVNAVEGVASDLNPVISATVNALHEAGHIVKEIRLMVDEGEQKIAPNTVPDVTVPEPVPPAASSTTPGAPVDDAVAADEKTVAELEDELAAAKAKEELAAAKAKEAADEEADKGTGPGNPTPGGGLTSPIA